jgi:glycosyltransferase involved in cell wall biosynthesis
MIKVLGLALYGPLAASTRYRLGQYVPGLAENGVDLQIFYLLDDDYLRRSFRGQSLNVYGLLRSGLGRLAKLWNQNEYDVVILYCELFPFLMGWMERALIQVPYIYDFDDAFYLKYQSGRLGLARTLIGNKFENLIRGATAVTAGNNVLCQYAGQYNNNIKYLPTVVDTLRYLPQPTKRGAGVFTIGWIGSPSTSKYLSDLIVPLSSVGMNTPIRFVVIGGNAPIIPFVEVVEIAWNEQTEIDLINSFDVGVMPLPDNDWARGKCAFKLIQYMACAVPVIASPVGANIDLISSNNGLLASTSQEWIAAIYYYINNKEKRFKIGNAGRERIKKNYSLKENLPKLHNIIYTAYNKKK